MFRQNRSLIDQAGIVHYPRFFGDSKMVRTVGTILIWIVILFNQIQLCAKPLVRLTVEPGDCNRVDTPVFVELKKIDKALLDKPLFLEQLQVGRGNRKMIPYQIEYVDSPRLWWIIPGKLNVGQTRTFELTWIKDLENIDDVTPMDIVKKAADAVLRDLTEPPPFDWGEGTLMDGMLMAYQVTNDKRYLQYVMEFGNQWHKEGIEKILEDGTGHGRNGYCGHWGPGYSMAVLYELTGEKKYLELAEKVTDFIVNKAQRTHDGGLYHFSGTPQLWLDTLYMACPVLAHMSKIKDQPELLKEAVDQFEIYANHLQDEKTGLMYHMWDESTNKRTADFWGRGNGWVTMALVHVLETMNPASDDYDTVRDILKKQIDGIIARQDTRTGLWRTVLNADESYLETSATAMFLLGLIKARNMNVIDEAYDTAIQKGWSALKHRIESNGRVIGVSEGTDPSGKRGYIERGIGTYTWGTGAYLMAACAYAQLDLEASNNQKPFVPTVTALKPPVDIDKKNKYVQINKEGDNVLRYHHAAVPPPQGADPLYKRSAFIHPLWSPDGSVMTDIHPKDHIHHLGIWMPWTKTYYDNRPVDFWNLAKGLGTVRFKRFNLITKGQVFSGFNAEHEHVVFYENASEKTALNEIWQVRVFNVGGREKGYWLWDLVSTQRCASDIPLKLPQYRYGGLGFRATERWNPSTAGYLTSEGKTRKNSHATRARWCDMFGKAGQNWQGVAIMSHPDNFRHPEPIRTWDQGPIFFCYAPSQLGNWLIEPGNDYVWRYRFYVHDGKAEPEQIENYWRDFAAPPEITLEYF